MQSYALTVSNDHRGETAPPQSALIESESNNPDHVDWAQLYTDQNKYETQMSRHERTLNLPAHTEHPFISSMNHDEREPTRPSRQYAQPLSSEISRLCPIVFAEAERQALQSLTHQTACRVHEEEQLQSTSTALAQTAHDLSLLTRMCDEVEARGVREDAQRVDGEITVLVNREARVPPLFASSHRLVRTHPVSSTAYQRAEAGSRRLTGMCGDGSDRLAGRPGRGEGLPLSEDALDAVGVRLVGAGASRLAMPGESPARVVRTGADSPERAVFQFAMGARGKPHQQQPGERPFESGAAGVLSLARREVAAALVAAMHVPEHRVVGACVQDQGRDEHARGQPLTHLRGYERAEDGAGAAADTRQHEADSHKPALRREPVLRREHGAAAPPRSLTWSLAGQGAAADTDGRWVLAGARELLVPVSGVKRQLELEGRQRMRGTSRTERGDRREPTRRASPPRPEAAATLRSEPVGVPRGQRTSSLSAVVTGGYAPHRGVFRHQRNPEFVEFFDKTRVRAYQRMCSTLPAGAASRPERVSSAARGAAQGRAVEEAAE